MIAVLSITCQLTFAYSRPIVGTFPENIAFSEESRFARCNDSKWIWPQRGDVNDEVLADKVKYASGTMVFGGISKGFCLNLCFPDGFVTSWFDLRMLDDEGIILSIDARYGKGGISSSKMVLPLTRVEVCCCGPGFR
jgi:hypothetical protein